MKKYLLVTFLIATLFIAALPSAFADDQAINETEQITITGQISHGGNPKATTNPVLIEIYEWDGEKSEIGDNVGRWNKPLDNEGRFSIVFDYDNTKRYCMMISETGFVVYNWPETTMKKIKSFDAYEIDFTTMKEKTMSLTDVGHYICMMGSHGSVTGKVMSASGNKPFLNGVKITITSIDSNIKYTTYTSGGGVYTFTDVETGEYTLVAESKGFKEYKLDEEDYRIIVEPDETEKVLDIEMEPTNDISTAHMMTVAGVVCVLAMLVCVIVYIFRLKKSV